MQLSEDDLKRLWQTETTRGSALRGECLSTETLARAGADELSPDEKESVAVHLSGCSDCAEEYRIALSVREWAGQTAANHVQAFPARNVAQAIEPSWWQRLTGFNPLLSALTAALLIVSLALGVWLVRERQQSRALVAQLSQQQNEAVENAALRDQIAELQSRQAELRAQLATQASAGQNELKAEIEKLKNELAELARPQLDVPQIDLDPNSETRSAGGSKTTAAIINVPAQAISFTINLPGAGSKPFPQYLIELIDARTNKTVWSAQRKQDNETTFTLTLAKRSLPAGRYRIRVYGVNGRRELLSSYDLQLNYATSKAR